MEVLISFLMVLNTLSPLAVISLLGVCIFYLVRHQKVLTTVKTNDLHEMPEIADTLRRIETLMVSLDAYLRARL